MTSVMTFEGRCKYCHLFRFLIFLTAYLWKDMQVLKVTTETMKNYGLSLRSEMMINTSPC